MGKEVRGQRIGGYLCRESGQERRKGTKNRGTFVGNPVKRRERGQRIGDICVGNQVKRGEGEQKIGGKV